VSVKFPLRDTYGTVNETALAATGQPLEEPAFHVRSLIGAEDIDRAISDWEEFVSGQRGRKLKFKRWREFTPSGHMRYVSSNKGVDAVAIVEGRTYDTEVATNRGAFIFRREREAVSLPPGTSRG